MNINKLDADLDAVLDSLNKDISLIFGSDEASQSAMLAQSTQAALYDFKIKIIDFLKEA